MITTDGNTLEEGEDGNYIEVDPAGVPLGEWHWDDDLEEWVFEEYPPPLANLPQTGLSNISDLLAIIGIVFMATGLTLIPRKKRSK